MFSIIKGGCFSKHSQDFIMERPNGLPHYLFLNIKSPSELYINDKVHMVKPNSVLIVKPDTPYSYKNPNGEYIDDWLHFDCEAEDVSLLDEGMLQTPFPISNSRLLTTYIQQILWENNFSPAESKAYYTDSLFKILIKHLADDFLNPKAEQYSPYRFKLQNLRLSFQSEPCKKYSVGDIAAGLDISTSYFQYLYKQFFGISFHSDIINMRINHSKELITCTLIPFEQIAYMCGYSNEVHFYRQFLGKTGMTPGEYRKIYSTSSTKAF